MHQTSPGVTQKMIQTLPTDVMLTIAHFLIVFAALMARKFPVNLNPKKPHKWLFLLLTTPSIMKIGKYIRKFLLQIEPMRTGVPFLQLFS
jgi:hypothetical protein